jgi:hypothetical protein
MVKAEQTHIHHTFLYVQSCVLGHILDEDIRLRESGWGLDDDVWIGRGKTGPRCVLLNSQGLLQTKINKNPVEADAMPLLNQACSRKFHQHRNNIYSIFN